ncbi:hypothetical protein [Methanocaldococcus bathoardescens]|uniref:hypothetical protein n=1 Tax=Methanocaldococcus bathoardescens TaxID=1301915 RepID=UPI00129304D8|nr:hypothetical protein [Methanocaldococcus bathoardescens]
MGIIKKGPKTLEGKINKMLTGDGRKKPVWAKKTATLEEMLGIEKTKKEKENFI